jgi:hypothetical protein
MPRKKLTLEELVADGVFDAGNHRHRRALDESEPLTDPELEALRQTVVWLRSERGGAKTQSAKMLQKVALTRS